jgi:hypothetical protein
MRTSFAKRDLDPVALRAFGSRSRQGVSVRQTPSLSCASRSQLNLQELVFENSRIVSAAKKVLASQALRPRQTIRREAFAAPFHPPPGVMLKARKEKGDKT